VKEQFVRSVAFERDNVDDLDRYPFSIPAVHSLTTLALHPRITLFAGENGSGKSTLVEAIAIAAGLSPEGGSRNMSLATRASHSQLHEHLRLTRGTRTPRDGFFLRAESVFNVATHIEELEREGAGLIASSYGGVSLHEQSHGESFLSLVVHRFFGPGFYVLDEPEAALSVQGQLAVIARMHELVTTGSQFVVSTHSPILLAYPDAQIYALSESGIEAVGYDETDAVVLTRSFLADRNRFLRHLLAD
jgi:predicted ATPase